MKQTSTTKCIGSIQISQFSTRSNPFASKELPGISFLATLLFVGFQFIADAQSNPPEIHWQQSLGGTGLDEAHAIQQTPDKGFIVAGYELSLDGDDVSGNHGLGDEWIVKLDSSGNMQWQKCIGGSDDDWAHAIHLTSDGGYVVGGYSKSDDGNASINNGIRDYWIIKLDSIGNILWEKSLGGSSKDNAHSLQLTQDGGFILAGVTESNDGDVTGNNGGKDCWIVKLDPSGNIEWQKCLGGSDDDDANCIQQTNDGGFVFTGFSYSINGNLTGNQGGMDCWVVKLDAAGNITWQKNLGGSADDDGYWILEVDEAGYVVAGFSKSNDGNLSLNNGGADCWIIKLDGSGNIEWQETMGGTSDDVALTIEEISDGNLIMAGYTGSNEIDVSGNHGALDAWLVGMDHQGVTQWQKCLGGTLDEYAYAVHEIGTGRLIVAGGSSSNDGDVSGNHGDSDFWIFELENSTGIEGTSANPSHFLVYPNPTQDQTTLLFTLSQSSYVTVKLLDLKGRELQVILNEELAAGDHSLQVNTDHLAKGAYLLKMIYEERTVTQKLVMH